MKTASHVISRHISAAFGLVIGIGGAATAWSFYAPLEGAVVSSGTVIVEGNAKKVQHLTGGIVGALRVTEGSRVDAGDILIKLDETVARGNLEIILNDLTSQRARMTRLRASRDNLDELVFPPDLVEDGLTSRNTQNVIDGERNLYKFKKKAREEQRQQYEERIKQTREEIRGLGEQKKSLEGQLRVANSELTDLSQLFEHGIVQRPRVSALEREVLQKDGSLGETIAKVAQAQAKISETEVQIVQLDHDFITDVIKDLRETETKINELQEKKIGAVDQLRRLDIRAPISGMVHQLAVHTVGGVVSPSETLMMIIPSNDNLVVEIKISPSDIDQLSIGQSARVRFSAFNRRTTDEVIGEVYRIGADLTKEPQTNQSYYSGGISISKDELAKLKGLKIVPGMPAEIFVKTDNRTLANYLGKPLMDQMQRAFRER